MDIVSGITLYAILWWMTFFVVLPLNLKTQGDEGEVVPGTPEGAPHSVNIRRKVFITTIAAVGVWLVTVLIVYHSGLLNIRMFDVNHTLPPVSSSN